MADICITVDAQEPGVSYRIVRVGEAGRRDCGVFRRAYSTADVEAMKIGPEDEVVYEDDDRASKELLPHPY